MVVHDFNAARSWLAVLPLEANTPLLIDPNGVLSGPVTLECLKAIAGQGPKGIEGRSSVQNCKPPFRLLLEAYRSRRAASRTFFFGAPFGFKIAEIETSDPVGGVFVEHLRFRTGSDRDHRAHMQKSAHVFFWRPAATTLTVPLDVHLFHHVAHRGRVPDDAGQVKNAIDVRAGVATLSRSVRSQKRTETGRPLTHRVSCACDGASERRGRLRLAGLSTNQEPTNPVPPVTSIRIPI